jgi:hypothetical protein
MGLTEEGSEVAKVAQPAPKQAAKPAKPGAKK